MMRKRAQPTANSGIIRRLAPASRASEKKTEKKSLYTETIDFLPPNSVIDEICNPSLYNTDVQLSQDVIEKEVNEKYRWEFLEKYGSNSGLSTDKTITDTLKQQLVSIAKSLDDDKWLYEATKEADEL